MSENYPFGYCPDVFLSLFLYHDMIEIKFSNKKTEIKLLSKWGIGYSMRLMLLDCLHFLSVEKSYF